MFSYVYNLVAYKIKITIKWTDYFTFAGNMVDTLGGVISVFTNSIPTFINFIFSFIQLVFFNNS